MKKFLMLALALLVTCQSSAFAKSFNDVEKRVETLKKVYSLNAHVEGGYFSEVYTAPFSQDNRATAGSIYFMLVGKDVERGQREMVIVPADSIFAAENLNDKSYTLISCVTTPKFRYEGFQLVTRNELKKIYPQADEKLLSLAYGKLPN